MTLEDGLRSLPDPIAAPELSYAVMNRIANIEPDTTDLAIAAESGRATRASALSSWAPLAPLVIGLTLALLSGKATAGLASFPRMWSIAIPATQIASLGTLALFGGVTVYLAGLLLVNRR